MQLHSLRFLLVCPLVWMATACATVSPQAQSYQAEPQQATLLMRSNEASPVDRGAPVELSTRSLSVVQASVARLNPPKAAVALVEQRPAARSIGFGYRDAPPEGLVDFCARQPQECGQPSQNRTARANAEGFMLVGRGPDLTDMEVAPQPSVKLVRPIRPFAATTADIASLNRVNRQINRAMVGVTDQIAFGRNEFWTMPLSAPEFRSVRTKPLADCEDFALEKRRALIAAGIPETAIYLAVAISPRTSLHAVVIVTTDRGDLVLDNLNDWLLGYHETGYTWVKRQSTTSLMDWTDAMVTAPGAFQTASLSQPKRPFSEAQATVTNPADIWSRPLWYDAFADAPAVQASGGGR